MSTEHVVLVAALTAVVATLVTVAIIIRRDDIPFVTPSQPA
jgi:hypothetical protein